MTVVATGLPEVTVYQAIVLKTAIRMYLRSGIKANRAYTPTNMLATVGRIVGKKYKRGQLPVALDDIQEWIDEQRAARDASDG